MKFIKKAINIIVNESHRKEVEFLLINQMDSSTVAPTEQSALYKIIGKINKHTHFILFFLFILSVFHPYNALDDLYYVFLAVVCLLEVITISVTQGGFISHLKSIKTSVRLLELTVLTGFFILIVITSIINLKTGTILPFSLRTFFWPILYVLILSMATRIPSLFKKILPLFLYFTLICAAYIAIETLMLHNPLFEFYRFDKWAWFLFYDGTMAYRTTGLFLNSLILSTFFSFMIWIGAYLFRSSPVKLISFTALCAIVLYTTKSRSSLVLLAATFIFYMIRYAIAYFKKENPKLISFSFLKTKKTIRQRSGKRRMELVLCTILVIIVAFLGVGVYHSLPASAPLPTPNGPDQPVAPDINIDVHSFGGRLAALFTGGDSSTNHRFLSALLILDEQQHNPRSLLLGNGGGSSSSLISNSKITSTDGFKAVDNQYLSIFYDYGLITVILFIAFGFIILFRCFKKSDYTNPLRRLMIMGFFLLEAIFFVVDAMNWTSLAFIWIFTAALLTIKPEKVDG